MARKPRKKPSASIKAAADRAEARATGKPIPEPEATPLHPAETAMKRPEGRPSKYNPKFCDEVMSLGEAGKSRTQIATFLRISRQTLLNWEEAHPEFLDAMSMASQFAQSWWEDQGQSGISDKSFNGHVYSFQMKNRFRADYTEKVELKHDASTAFANLWQRVGGGAPESSP